MKTVVIYVSKSGYVKNYAQWIAKSLEADIFELSEISIKDLEKYETVIYGGGLYVGGINKVKFIIKNEDKLEGKNIVIFFSGAAPPKQKDIDYVIDRTFTKEQKSKFMFFYMRGGFDFSKLSIRDKLLMTLLKIKLKYKRNLLPDERGMLNAYKTPVDFTGEKNTVDLVNYVKSL